MNFDDGIESSQAGSLSFLVTPEDDSQRLDVFLAKRLPQYSRTHLRRAIDGGTVLVDGTRTKVAYRLVPNQRITVSVPEMPRESPEPEDIALDILHEDEALVVVNKPPGMVVHPAKGHWAGTLTSALAFHFSSLSQIGGVSRPGIVHRLDRDTSGVIVIAKTDRSHMKLAAQFEARSVRKQYVAICRGAVDRDRDIIRRPIGAHPKHRERMAIREGHETSRVAITEYEVYRRYRGFSRIDAYPKTGRTHQIRVHLAHIGCPVVCDRLYASHAELTLGELTGDHHDRTVVLARQALHAFRLEIEHPTTNQPVAFEAPIPADMRSLMVLLEANCAS